MIVGVAKRLLLSTALLLVSTAAGAAGAAKVVGTCKVDVAGAHPFSITGKIYEGTTPDDSFKSSASTHAWALQWAEEYRPYSAVMADQKKKMADEMLFVLTISCASEKGMLFMQPYGNSPKVTDYPGGPHTFRLVGRNMHDFKPGDVAAALTSREFTTGMIEPAEPGELKITRSDNEKLVATFSFKSRTYTVNGSVDFTRPKELVK